MNSLGATAMFMPVVLIGIAAGHTTPIKATTALTFFAARMRHLLF